jgi:formate--tetrahydrofolate ligase
MAFPSDLDIASAAPLAPLTEIAAQMGIGPHLLEAYGDKLAKIRMEAVEELSDRPKAKYVVVTAITPTPLGEGKTTTTVGLGQAFKHIGKKATISLRQPSMGPTFGIKGGAAGGGYSQVIPMDLLNLHLTGDFHAVTAAHNLLRPWSTTTCTRATNSASTSTTSRGVGLWTSTIVRCATS